MFKQIAYSWVILSCLSLASFADVQELPGHYTKYMISFDDTEKIAVTFDVTAEVDACNHHGLTGELLPISDRDYVADLGIMSTEMWCSDRTMRTQVFTKTFEVAGSWLTVLVPENTIVTAEPLR